MTQFMDQADYLISRLSNFPKWQRIECLLHEPWITDRAQRIFAGNDKIIATEHIPDMSRKVISMN